MLSIVIKKIINNFIYSLIYISTLICYYKYIVPLYGYTGFFWEPDGIKIIEGVSLVLIISSILPVSFKKPSDVFLHIQFLFPILPMIVLYGAMSWPRSYLYFVIFSYFILIFIVEIFSKIKIKILRVTRLSTTFFGRMLFVLSWVVIVSIVLFGGGRYLNFNLSKIYELRSISASSLPSIYAYISPLISKIILPFSLVIAVINRDRLLAFGSIVGSILMFGLTAHKGPLFYPVMVLGLYFFLSRKYVVQYILLGYLMLIFLSSTDFSIGWGGGWVGSILLRRVCLVPAFINYLYYDFFSINTFTFWAQSKITLGLLNFPYDINIPHLIGREYFGNVKLGANTGWLGCGYMHAGFSGMLVYSVVIGLLLSVLNKFSRVIEKKILVALCFTPFIVLMTSSDLPTSLLNHGLLLALFFLTMFSTRNKNISC